MRNINNDSKGSIVNGTNTTNSNRYRLDSSAFKKLEVKGGASNLSVLPPTAPSTQGNYSGNGGGRP
jgi:hypothetical protein